MKSDPELKKAVTAAARAHRRVKSTEVRLEEDKAERAAAILHVLALGGSQAEMAVAFGVSKQRMSQIVSAARTEANLGGEEE